MITTTLILVENLTLDASLNNRLRIIISGGLSGFFLLILVLIAVVLVVIVSMTKQHKKNNTMTVRKNVLNVDVPTTDNIAYGLVVTSDNNELLSISM